MPERQHEYRLYAPNLGLEDIEKLKTSKAAVMVVTVPKGSLFLGIQNIPSIIDLMGFSSGGTQPGFAYWVDCNKEETEVHFFTNVVPNAPIDTQVDDGYIIPRGTSQAMGVPICCLELAFDENKTNAEEVRKALEEKLLVVDAVPYKPPDALLQHVLPKVNKEG